jgi:hypothetical protein
MCVLGKFSARLDTLLAAKLWSRMRTDCRIDARHFRGSWYETSMVYISVHGPLIGCDGVLLERVRVGRRRSETRRVSVRRCQRRQVWVSKVRRNGRGSVTGVRSHVVTSLWSYGAKSICLRTCGGGTTHRPVRLEGAAAGHRKTAVRKDPETVADAYPAKRRKD